MRSNEGQGCLLFAVITIAGAWYLNSRFLSNDSVQSNPPAPAHDLSRQRLRPNLDPPEVTGDIIGNWYWNCPAPAERNWWKVRTVARLQDGAIEVHERHIGHSGGLDSTYVYRFRRDGDVFEPLHELNSDRLFPFRLAGDGLLEVLWVDPFTDQRTGRIDDLMFPDADAAEQAGDRGVQGQARGEISEPIHAQPSTPLSEPVVPTDSSAHSAMDPFEPTLSPEEQSLQNERVASSILDAILDDGDQPDTERRLRQLIETYPDTRSAEHASQLLGDEVD